MNDALKTQVGGDHYRSLAIQPTEYCQKNKLGFCEANVVKYVTRHRSKGGRKDIEKAIHYLEILLALEYPEDEVTVDPENVRDAYKELTDTYEENKDILEHIFSEHLGTKKAAELNFAFHEATKAPKEWDGEFGSVDDGCDDEWMPLEDGEIIQRGDEFYSISDQVWKPRLTGVGAKYEENFHASTRRRILRPRKQMKEIND